MNNSPGFFRGNSLVLKDLFGTGKALDALWQNLPLDARANSVFLFAGEFGRQIRSNGDAGTDHGEGTYVILIGGAACDWMQPGSGDIVFPDRVTAPIEQGINLADLFS